jgi:hypothetical protein
MTIKELIIEKSVGVFIGVIGSIATAILLWIGTTLQTLTVKMEGVMTRIEANDKTFNDFKEQIQFHEYKIDTLDKRVDRLENKKPFYELYPQKNMGQR